VLAAKDVDPNQWIHAPKMLDFKAGLEM